MLWAMCLSFPVVKRWHDNEAQGGGRREREERGDKFRRGDEACMKWKSKTLKKGERWVGGMLGEKSEKKTCSWESDKVCDSVVHWPVVLCHFITVTLPPSLSLWHYIDVSKFVWHHTGCFFFNWASPLDWPPPNLLGLAPPKFSKCWNHIHFARHLDIFRS